MGLLGRLLLYLLLALGVLRMAFYFAYAVQMLPMPLEGHNLEAKMVLMADRVATGQSLYPAWWGDSYVANWFGPVNSLLVGLTGRLLGADVRGLFLIGRAFSFASAVATSLVLAVAIGRRYGRGAGLAGAVMSLGAGPMYGFTVMVRPDALAELLGVGGFLLSDGSSRWARRAGVALLILAVLTKQTAAVFVLAAALAPALDGRGRRGLGVLGATCAALIVVVVAVNVLLEPNFARSLVGERVMPWSFGPWLYLLRRVAVSCSDLFILPAIGLGLWLGDRSRPREVGLAALALLLLAAALVLSGKRGADMNYYLDLRVAEALAVGALWHAVHATPPPDGSRRRSAALNPAILVALVATVPSLSTAAVYVHLAARNHAFYGSPEGREKLLAYRWACALARDPRVHLLTDSGLIDLYQGQRAVFGDPWLFRTLVEHGLLRPTAVVGRIDTRFYDIIITTHDLDSPRYLNEDLRLPKGLVERVRSHYVLRTATPGLFVYRRRGGRTAR